MPARPVSELGRRGGGTVRRLPFVLAVAISEGTSSVDVVVTDETG